MLDLDRPDEDLGKLASLLIGPVGRLPLLELHFDPRRDDRLQALLAAVALIALDQGGEHVQLVCMGEGGMSSAGPHAEDRKYLYDLKEQM